MMNTSNSKFLLCAIVLCTACAFFPATAHAQSKEKPDLFPLLPAYLENCQKIATLDGYTHEERLRVFSAYWGTETAYELLYVNDDLFSYKAHTLICTGYIRPSTVDIVGSISLKTKKKLTLQDIAPTPQDQETLLKQLQDSIRKTYRAKDNKESLDSVLKYAFLTENFYFGEDGIHFVFPECQISCYADGCLEFVIPGLAK